MDTKGGELIPAAKAAFLDPMDLEEFTYGEMVQVKEGFFEVVKIDLRGQRLVLKPIPRPSEERDEEGVLKRYVRGLRPMSQSGGCDE